MVEDDYGLRIGAGEVGKLGKLGMVEPGLEGQIERCQTRKPGTPSRIKHLSLNRIGARLGERVAGIASNGVADAANAAIARGDRGFHHPCDPIAKPEIGKTDNATHSRVGPYWPLALIAAVPLTNSVSPTGFISVGPSARYIEPHSMNTVSVILCPLPTSASNWSRRNRFPGWSHR